MERKKLGGGGVVGGLMERSTVVVGLDLFILLKLGKENIYT